MPFTMKSGLKPYSFLAVTSLRVAPFRFHSPYSAIPHLTGRTLGLTATCVGLSPRCRPRAKRGWRVRVRPKVSRTTAASATSTSSHSSCWYPFFVCRTLYLWKVPTAIACHGTSARAYGHLILRGHSCRVVACGQARLAQFAWHIGFRDSERSPTVDWRRRRMLGIRRMAGGRQLALLAST